MVPSIERLMRGLMLLLFQAWFSTSFSFSANECRLSTLNRMARRQMQTHLANNNDPTQQEDVDYTILDVDSPLFLDMPWPSEAGPLSAAFARHMQWKRKLSDGERLRWQRWAVYQRMKVDNRFQYSLEDYITQNMQQELGSQAVKHLCNNDTTSSSMFSAMGVGLKNTEAQEVRAVMTAYYSAFNRRNFDEIRALWLPDENSELVFPGYVKVRGDQAIEKMYQKLVTESAPMGSVKATISGIQCYGNVAMVHTVEEVQAGSALKTGGRKRGAAPATSEPQRSSRPRRVLATTILRKAHKQWRILSHHALRMWSSPFTGDSVDVSFTRRDARLRAELMREADTEARAIAATAGTGKEGSVEFTLEEVERMVRSPAASLGDSGIAGNMNPRKLGEGALRPVLRQRPDGTFERVITLDAPATTTSATVATSSTGDKAGDKGGDQSKGADIPRTTKDTSARHATGVAGAPAQAGKENLGSISPAAITSTASETAPAGSPVLLGNAAAAVEASSGAQIDTGIDEDAPVSKQTVQAIRRLHTEGRLTKEEKELLLSSVISSLAQNKASLVEVAYEMLYAYPVHEEEHIDEEKAHLNNFADQCRVILRNLLVE